jgi:hypothetical protein
MAANRRMSAIHALVETALLRIEDLGLIAQANLPLVNKFKTFYIPIKSSVNQSDNFI